MKTPIDSSTAGSGATLALLNGSQDFQVADLWKITLNGGGVVRWHGAGMNTPLSFSAASGQSASANGTYLAGPGIDRGKISTKVGLEAATMDVTISATLSDLINGTPVIPFLIGNGLDGATVVLYKAFLPSWGGGITGVVTDFSGRVTSLNNVSRAQATITISSWLVLLKVNMGPDVYQAGCLNQHYDADCGLTPTNVAGAVSGSPTTTLFNTNLSNADHYFDKGTITFTSGANAGVSRTVQTSLNASGQISLAYPLPVAPSAGDTFNAVRGCLLTMADCSAQANLINFRGQPFTPAATNGVTGLPTS